MMDQAKIKVLTAFLGQLPESLALRLVKAIEVDRLAGGSALPHDVILEGIRPVLRKAQSVERTPSPLRLFTRPFEDLLSVFPRKEKQKGSIARHSLKVVWSWLATTVIPDAVAAYESAVKAAVFGYRNEEAMAVAAEFWKTAAAAIQAALPDDKARKAARPVLGDEAGVADAIEIAQLLSVGPLIIELQAEMPRNLPALTDEYIWKLRKIYERVTEMNADAAPYVAVLAMNRLARPWEALRLPLLVARQTQDTLIASTDMGLAGEILLNEMDMHATFIRNARPQAPLDSDTMAQHVSRFAELSTGIVKEVEMRRDGRWGQRLMKDRAAIGGAMDGFMERAPREVLAALPTQKTGNYASSPRVPDVSRPLDPEKAKRALEFAKLVARCKSCAANACFGAKQKDAEDEIIQALRSYSEDLVKELRASEGARRANAEQFFDVLVEMTTLVFSSEEGEFLRRRGRAALGTAVAA
ncbi:MAG: hypothetical protein HY243_10960 [Proteobacteria bacterium]|nr:hypothetical protein [Pseudomonadota bacterium]